MRKNLLHGYISIAIKGSQSQMRQNWEQSLINSVAVTFVESNLELTKLNYGQLQMCE